MSSYEDQDHKRRQCVEKQRHYSANKGPYSQGNGLPSGHTWLWDLDYKEGRTPKNWCLQTVVLKKFAESPLDSKEIKPVNLKGDQAWIFTGRTDAEVEAPIFWLSDANWWLFGKLSDAGKDRGQKEKRASEDEKAGLQHWCNQHELSQTPGDGEGYGGLACCSPWGHKEGTQLDNWIAITITRIKLDMTYIYRASLVAQMVKESDLGLTPGLQRAPRGEHGNPFPYSCLENPHGQRSLVGYSPCGCKESDITEWLSTHTQFTINSTQDSSDFDCVNHNKLEIS